MTKYVLNSGGISNQPELKRQFHQEIIRDLGASPRFLICNFGQPREYWETKYPKYCQSILADMSEDTQPTFEMAYPATFIDQCARADVIYFSGGDDHLFLYWLKQCDLPAIFQNKIVATNSGSSDVLCSNFWACDWRQCLDGLGLIPAKFMAHFRDWNDPDDPRGLIDWDAGKAELAAYGDPNLPIYALREGEYKVILADK
jgi:hypothetical protein